VTEIVKQEDWYVGYRTRGNDNGISGENVICVRADCHLMAETKAMKQVSASEMGCILWTQTKKGHLNAS